MLNRIQLHFLRVIISLTLAVSYTHLDVYKRQEQKEFIENKLQTNIFPTHFVIENGIVKKVVNESSELIDFAKNK